MIKEAAFIDKLIKKKTLVSIQTVVRGHNKLYVNEREEGWIYIEFQSNKSDHRWIQLSKIVEVIIE